jgi:hypothetical protein
MKVKKIKILRSATDLKLKMQSATNQLVAFLVYGFDVSILSACMGSHGKWK